MCVLCVCVRVGGGGGGGGVGVRVQWWWGGGQSSVLRGVREGRGGKTGGVQLPDSLQLVL